MANTYSLGLVSASSQNITINDASTLKITGVFTIEAWILTSATAYQHIFTDFDQNSSIIYGFDLFLDNTGKANFQIGLNTGNVAGTDYKLLTTSGAFNSGSWVHIAAVYDGTNMLIYNNETLTASVAWTSNPAYPATTYPRIGSSGNQPTANEYFNGKIDDFRVWNTARSATEISDNLSRELAGNESGLVLYMKLNNNYTNSTSNSFTIGVNGAPTFSTDVPFADSTTTSTSTTSTSTTTTSTSTSRTTSTSTSRTTSTSVTETSTSTSTTTTTSTSSSTSTTTTSTSTTSTSTSTTSTSTTLDLKFTIEKL